ncbi:Clp protease ClpP [Hymenobacter negativus]|uniref:Clp protease ClpP n=1 Tax=Hymenobacter negativus TaxID=2795026 RepID=A0ABS3QHY4_9BACT|nr:Clp protease ClpP [Hymenobacter negativus]MBO2010850.1 Clp protease ClpP [Hymenobacter negativus]
MPELLIPVGENIGPGFIDWEEYEYVPGFTVDDIRMRLEYAAYQGQAVDSITLQMGINYGGSVRHAIEIYNYVRALGIPVTCHVMSMTASAGTIVALAADEVILEQTAQWMVHRPLYTDGTSSQRSEELRADADRLDRDTQNMVDIYVARSGQNEAAVRQLVSVDRFMTAQEAADFGFVTTVKPLASKAPSSAQTQARLRSYKMAVARADKRRSKARTAPTPNAKPASASSKSPRPMAKKVIPIAKAVAKTAVPTAQQKANAAAVAALAKSLGVKATIEGVEAADDEPDAAVESTETDQDGALLYHDGPLAEGSAVFYDEALTEVAEDGEYGLADGRTIVVTDGVVESITEASAEEQEDDAPASTAAITAAVQAAMAPVMKKVEDLTATVDRFKKLVPETPTPRARAASSSQTDPKGGKAGGNKPHPMDKAKT